MKTFARIVAPLVLLGFVVRGICRQGYKLDAVVSITCMVAFHLFSLPYTSPRADVPIAAYIIICTTYVMWIGFALTALRTRRSPNAALGGMSLTFLLSPFSLMMLGTLLSLLVPSWTEPYIYGALMWLCDVLWGII